MSFFYSANNIISNRSPLAEVISCSWWQIRLNSLTSRRLSSSGSSVGGKLGKRWQNEGGMVALLAGHYKCFLCIHLAAVCCAHSAFPHRVYIVAIIIAVDQPQQQSHFRPTFLHYPTHRPATLLSTTTTMTLDESCAHAIWSGAKRAHKKCCILLSAAHFVTQNGISLQNVCELYVCVRVCVSACA